MATISVPQPAPVVVPVVVSEKESYSSGALQSITSNSLVATIRDTYYNFQARRELLGLSNPGTVENVAKEVQRDVFLNNLTFSGLRAELTKAFSVAPLFQVCHSFSQGSQQMPPYVFMALFGTSKVCQRSKSSRAFVRIQTVLTNLSRFSAKVMSTAISLSPHASITDGRTDGSQRQAHRSLRQVLVAQVVHSSVSKTITLAQTLPHSSRL